MRIRRHLSAACAAGTLCAWGLALAHAQFDVRSPEALRDMGMQLFDRAGTAPLARPFKFQEHSIAADAAQSGTFYPPAALPSPAVKVPLDPLLNGMYKSKALFMAGNVPVHIFGDRSRNKHTWFLGLYPEGDEKPTFFSSMKLLRQRILRIPVFNRSSEFEIRGLKYTVYIEGELLNQIRSKIIIEPQSTGEPKKVFTAAQLARATFEAGHPLKLGDAQYRLLYTQDFMENENGEFSGFSKDRSIAFMFATPGGFGVYHFYERNIPKNRILVATPQSQGPNENDVQQESLTLGLRINNAHELEIYYPVAPAVASRAP